MLANPAKIEASLGRALAKPADGWFVLGASRSYGGTLLPQLPDRLRRGRHGQPSLGPWRETVADTELVLWRNEAHGLLHVAAAACPHMGAHLADGRVQDGCLVCPWHGLALTGSHGSWKELPVHDDGVLIWVQMNPHAPDSLDAPVLSKRPDLFLDGVIRVDGDVRARRCDRQSIGPMARHALPSVRVQRVTGDRRDRRCHRPAGVLQGGRKAFGRGHRPLRNS